MESRVLIPPEFTLTPDDSTSGLCVCTQQRVERGTKFSPHQGNVRLGVLPLSNFTTHDQDTLRLLGSYNEIQREGEKRSLRRCNWVTFLRTTNTETQANLRACFTTDGKPEFETLHNISSGVPLLAYVPRHHKSRQPCEGIVNTVATILHDSPLDLSQELISREETQTASSPPVSPCSSSPEPEVSTQSPQTSGVQRGTTQTMQRVRGQQRALLPCDVCGKTFDRPSLLKRHMRTHTGERPHACDVCEKRFSTSSSLNTHRRIHSGEKPHACGVCGKRFTASSNLYYHRMTHTKEKPHKCSLCLKSFPTPGDLRSHQYVHSGAWPFRCSACGRGFSKQTNLRNHLFLHTGDKPHLCLVCGKKFALACNLRAHAKTHEDGTDEVVVDTTDHATPPLTSPSTSVDTPVKISKSTVHKAKQQQSFNQWNLLPRFPTVNQQDITKMPALWSGCGVFPVTIEDLQRSLMLEAHILLNALQHQ